MDREMMTVAAGKVWEGVEVPPIAWGIPPGANWIPMIATVDGKTVAQLNGDGTLFVDWPAVEAACAKFSVNSGSGLEVLHALLALRDGRFADAPRDWKAGVAA